MVWGSVVSGTAGAFSTAGVSWTTGGSTAGVSTFGAFTGLGSFAGFCGRATCGSLIAFGRTFAPPLPWRPRLCPGS